MSIVDLYRAFNVRYLTEGDRHCRPGWVNTSCPFCTGNPGAHLGVNLETWHFNCWRCGWHPTEEAISALTGVSRTRAKELIQQYRDSRPVRRPTKETNKLINIKPLKHPSDTGPLQKYHRRYLERRGFDPDRLVHQWDLLGTGPVSYLDDVNYRFRILAPIIWDGKEVSFQTRDVTDKAMVKYMACPQEREIIHHKLVLYGRTDKWSDVGICVEGITDVWKLGFRAFATLGIQFKLEQVNLITKMFKRVVILFDSDRQAQKQARKLAALLRDQGVSTHIETLTEGDPGSLSQKDARYLARTLTSRRL